MTTRRIGRATQRAAEIWAEWHQKDPDDVSEMDYPLEKHRVFDAGHADSITYWSTKWEDDDEPFEYLHEFDSGPRCYLGDGDGDEGDMKSLLGVARIASDAEASLPILAGVSELIVKHDDGTKTSLRFAEMPMLCSTLDKRGLIILSVDGPIIIRGGKMYVDERGIHR